MQHRNNIRHSFAAFITSAPALALCSCALVEPALDAGLDASVSDLESESVDSTRAHSMASESARAESTNSVVTSAVLADSSSPTPGDSHPASSTVGLPDSDATDPTAATADATITDLTNSDATRDASMGHDSTTNADAGTTDTFTSVDSSADAGALKCIKLTSPASDLSELTLESSSGGNSEWSFVSPQGFTGTLYVASDSLVSEMSTGATPALHIAGTVSDYAQFGLHFYPCVDASSFAGIVLDFAGTVGTDNLLRAEVQLRSTTVQGRVPAATCVPSNPELWWYECAPPDQMVTLPAPAAPIHLPWSTFSGGVPTLTPDPTQITGVELEFDWADGATPYQTDLTVNSISFLPQ